MRDHGTARVIAQTFDDADARLAMLVGVMACRVVGPGFSARSSEDVAPRASLKLQDEERAPLSLSSDDVIDMFGAHLECMCLDLQLVLNG